MRIVALVRLSEGVKPLTFSELFFHVVDEMVVNERVVRFSGRYLLCGETIKCFAEKQGRENCFVWQRGPFIDHLEACHYVTSDQITLEFSSMSDLRNKLVLARTMCNCQFSRSSRSALL